MQGKIRIFQIFAQTIMAIGASFESTFRNLPPRVAATQSRNYALGHKVRYKWTARNTTNSPIALSLRQVLNALGTISYKDAWGPVYDSEPVDRIYASNLADRVWGTFKIPPCGSDVTVPGAIEGVPGSVSGEAEVILIYAPSFFGPVPERKSMLDGGFPACLLGEDATIRLGSMGAQLSQTTTVSVDAVKVETVCAQSRETVPPIPTEYRGDMLIAGTNPYLSTGDARKIDQCFVLSEAIGKMGNPVQLQGVTSTAEILVDLDGHVQYQGPCETLTRDNENAGIGAPFGMNAKQVGMDPGFWSTMFVGEMYEIFGPMQREKATSGQACKRFEMRGIGPMENANVIVYQRRRYECPSALFERWADREGLSSEERKAIRIGGTRAANARLRRSEQIGVPQTVGSRKERGE